MRGRYEQFKDRNPNLSPRESLLSREMEAWSYQSLKTLFEGNEEFALYMREADHKAVFFYAHGRCWLMVRNPSPELHTAAPELVEDWIGASAPKEPGAEPVLMHREELPDDVKSMVEHVEVVEPTHPHEGES